MWFGSIVARDRGDQEKFGQRLMEIINARYRSRGYSVFWVHFAHPKNPQLPDLALHCRWIMRHRADKVLVANVAFERHVQEKIYPSNEAILKQIPEKIERLVAGGFHQGDCVSKFAATVHRRGVPVFVDEDLTELFFCRMRLDESIPLRRTRKQAAEYYRKLFSGGRPLDTFNLKLFRQKRAHTPWLVQP